MIYSNLIGKFLVQSFDGHLYLFVYYISSTNYIIMRPISDRTYKTVFDTFKEVNVFFKACKYSPKLHVLANECSKAIHAYITGEETKIQLVKSHNNCIYAAKTAIKSVKYHMIAGLQTVDPECPLKLLSEFI